TGLWSSQQTAFGSGKRRQNSFLQLNGIHAYGKVALSSTVIEDCKKNRPAQIPLYFDFNDTSKQTLENVLWFLISQLHHKSEDTQN
ncbi:hypothetical protein GQ43DRAFT_371053, partial [Delitschia confertaspora ATCC 74209]